MLRANEKLDRSRPPATVYVALAFRPAAFPLRTALTVSLRHVGSSRCARNFRKLVYPETRWREPRRHQRICIGQRFFAGRSSSSVITTRATARFLSRWFTRAMYSPSPLTNHVSRLTNHAPRGRGPQRAPRAGVVKGGTVNRPRAYVSCRKQTTAHMQGRNFPVHFLFPIFGRNPIALALRSLGGRSSSSVVRNRGEATHISRWFTRAKFSSFMSHESPITNHAVLPGVPETLRVLGWLAGVPETLRVLGWLPGTVTRVETLPSSTKQTTAYPSTRNVPAHTNFRRIFALRCHNRVAKLLHTLDPAAARFCVTMVLEVSGETA